MVCSSFRPLRVAPSPLVVPAPAPAAVWVLARSFAGLGVVAVRPSVRSFSGWVCVASFASRPVAAAFSRAAASELLGGGFCAVRPSPSGRRFRVSVPCLVPRVRVRFPARSVRVGRLRLRCPGRAVAAAALARSLSVPAASASLLPAAVSAALASASAVGFSGSRRPGGALPPAVVAAAVASVPASVPVFVGCARGVDAVVRSLCPRASVLSVAGGGFGRGRGAFAARSVACVRSVAVPGGVWVSFPCGACPAGLLPAASSSRAFSGSGSGSWASLAFALGSGVSCLVCLPAGVVPPAGWGLVALGSGWWGSSAPGAVQLSLF
ncbi:hypothetical protein [Coleofasciculus sp. FACHB-501]|uniref:hypothetical protein n=1 Tax=Cyanophyceae TaxID=3028117 RepID=UPI001689A79D|nr:hypothetical protein [Coleofasciculus sp. FACHB-501]MBD1836667.1 hypothetical protein [Coleofasciculus sp. FACHB-501]